MKALMLTSDGAVTASPPAKDVLAVLGSPFLLSDDYTLGAFFRMLAKNPELQRLGEVFPSLAAEHAGAAAGPPVPGGPEYLEFSKSVELIGFPGTPRVEIYRQLFGMKDGKRMDVRHEQLDALLGLDLRLGRLSHVVFGDRFAEMTFDTSYTLFEFLDAMAWELGFLNAPAACAMRR